ncbi:hypothetical protein [Pseudoxanthomonas winnipegensis]|uniref:Peptidase S74 domain-containing protein n=1 Tax=Pseudoxanthomonas winnipegensis TaxID=2480810 RepID=A0A4Q8LCG3_9GAMM|nr:hypothetical protein [Pseudoxanthomonas winnipegensis]TAA26568.1 hypothetical protein EA660_04875 [Pseudoxanthomonas winnipegensis]
MAGFQIQVTDAGRAALVNAEHNGTLPVMVASVGVTASAFTATGATLAVPNELKRLATISGGAAAPDTLHVTIRDDGADTYTMRGFGLYLADGTLFAAYGQADPILQKSAQSTLLLAADVTFADIDAESLVFGDTDFSVAPATTERQGIVELATSAEAIAGADAQRAVTPKAAKAMLDDRFGAGAPSGFVKGLLSLATAAMMRTALELKSAATRDATDFAPAAHTHTELPAGVLLLRQGGNEGGEITFQRGETGTTIDNDPRMDLVGDTLRFFEGGNVRFQFNMVTGALTAASFAGPLTGNASSATALAVARTITIGDTGKAFDGSGNVSWSFADIGLGSAARMTYTLADYAALAGLATEAASTKQLAALRDRVTPIERGGTGSSTASVARQNLGLGSASTYNTGTSGAAIPLLNAEVTWAGVQRFSAIDATGPVRGASGGVGKAFIIGNDASLWDIDSANRANLRGGSDESLGTLSFGSYNKQYVGRASGAPAMEIGALDGYLQYAFAGTWSYHFFDTTHVAYVKKSGAHAYWWRKSDTGIYGGANEVTLMELGDSGNLSIAGTCTASGGFQPSSSRELKTAFRPNPYGLAAVLRLETTLGKYRKWFNPDGRERVFHIAENIAEVMPQVAAGDGIEATPPGADAPQKFGGYSIEQMLAVHTKAIQDLHAIVVAQARRIATLEGSTP